MINFVKEGEQAKEKGKAQAVQTEVSGVRPKSPVSGPSRPESPVVKSGVSRPSHNDFARKYNPMYVLCRDFNGQVYAKYVGPYDGYIAWSIWVPKTLVTNLRGPIQKWVPKSKR
jgi:hypothetical protein